MKRIKLKNGDNELYPEDVNKIVKAMASAGYVCERGHAVIMWEKYSDMYGACWLLLPDYNREIVNAIAPFFEEEE